MAEHCSKKKRVRGEGARMRARKTTPPDVLQLFSLLQRSENNAVSMQQIAFCKFCRDLEGCMQTLLPRITDHTQTYAPYLERMYTRLESASERMLVWIVLRYNAMAVISNTGDDQGWNQASVLFVIMCRCRYMAELCHAASLVLYGRDSEKTLRRPPLVSLSEEQRVERMAVDEAVSTELDANHAQRTPRKKKRYGSRLPTPFFPLNRKDARRAFRIYTTRNETEVVDDFRPFLLHWRPCDHQDQSLVTRAVFMFGPNLRIGEYTQLQVMFQLQRLAEVWQFLAPTCESLHTTLAALLLRTAEIICHNAVGGDLILDAEAHYRDHSVYEGLGEVAESRSTTKKIVARPDGTVGFEDSDSVRKLKAQISKHGNTAKQASPQFVREVCGLFRGMYRELLFYKEHIATRIRPVDVLQSRAESALDNLVRRGLQDYIQSGGRGDFSSETLLQYNVQTPGNQRPPTLRHKDAACTPAAQKRAAVAGQRNGIETLITIVKQLLEQTASNARDSVFIDSLVKRIRIDSVPHGARERFASMNEGIMSSSAEMQERECTPYEILAHRTTFWPAVGLDYFLESHFSPRVHSRVICAVFQNILYTMDQKYVWNDKESATSASRAQLKPCVFYGCVKELEINTRSASGGRGGVLELVPKILIIMNSFYLMKDNDIYEVPGNNIYAAIVYWMLLFAEQKFTRTHGPMDKIHWLSFEQWCCKLVQDNLRMLVYGNSAL